jgi:putative FmdB family regulatory protein
MPFYDYECRDCGVFEKEFPMAKVKESVKCACGKKARRKFTVPNRIIRFTNVVLDPVPRHRITRGRGF